MSIWDFVLKGGWAVLELQSHLHITYNIVKYAYLNNSVAIRHITQFGGTMTSLYLTKAIAEEAVKTVMPAIMSLMKNRGVRGDLHIVVLDPTIKPWNGTFTDAVIYEHQIGDPQEWKHDYASIARSKAEQSWRTQMPNGIMQLNAAALIEAGDVKYASAFVEPLSGMTVGCSGIQGYFDYLVGGWVALACLQFAKDESEKAREKHGDFFN